MPLVSVIMPVYNGEKFLGAAIESILAQTFTDFELVIVDDGSTDGSAEIVLSFEAQDARVHFIQLAQNSGHGPALNAGLAVAKGEFIGCMDCDDISLPQRLEKQVAFLGSHPQIGAVGTWAKVQNEDLTSTHFEFKVPESHALIAFNLLFGASFVGSTVLTRRDYIFQVEGYDSEGRQNIDLDLSCRLLWHTSIRFANLLENLYVYRRHTRAISISDAGGHDASERRIRARMLQQLWSEVPPGAIDRFQRLRFQHKLGWAERRATKRDLRRLIDSLIAHSRVDPGDKPLLIAAMNQRLEQASPRLWQQFCHWRRLRFP
ncbi:MAG: glycosyltransferase family 2 protein [Anaerolineae bacterium]|nr:glycosyltransferase family 2 protein [Anaerolineae bacterium]